MQNSFENGILVTNENRLDNNSTKELVKLYDCEFALPYKKCHIGVGKIIEQFDTDDYEFIIKQSEVMGFSFGSMSASQPIKTNTLYYQPKK